MKDDSRNPGGPVSGAANGPSLPAAVDRVTFQAELDRLRAREKAHTHEGDAIAAARRRLPMVEVDPALTLTGPSGRSPCSTRSKGAGSSSPTTSCGGPAIPRPSSAKAARGSPPRSPSCPMCYVRDGDRVFETYWTTIRGVEAMDYSYALMDLTVYGRQEPWEDSPPGWPQQRSNTRTDAGAPDWPPVPVWPGGRPIAQWPRLEAGHSDDLTAGP